MEAAKIYKIGDFAKKVGVTPELLKYCEKKGLLQSIQGENSYRSFEFHQIFSVIEYLKLQNQGFSAEQVFDALHSESIDDLSQMQYTHQKEIEQQIRFLQALLQRNSSLEQMKDRFSSPHMWELTQSKDAWFLPHTDRTLITDDSRVIDRISSWNRWLPVVESACVRGFLKKDPLPICWGSWGYYVDAEFAQAQELDVSAPAEFVPASLQLQIYIAEPIVQANRYPDYVGHQMLEQLHLRQTGDAIQRIIAKMWPKDGRKAYSILQIPVAYE